MRDQRRDDHAKGLGEDDQAHDTVRANAKGSGGLGLSMAHRLDARTYIFRDEGTGIDGERQPERDQALAREDSTFIVEALELWITEM